MTLIRELIDIPDRVQKGDFVLRLSEDIEHPDVVGWPRQKGSDVAMNQQSPNVVVVAGPNGSGKSTAAPALLRDYLGITKFVNADVIAQGLSAFGSENVAMQAGRVMLERLEDLAGEQLDFAFETTLASRSFAPWLQKLGTAGYRAHLLFLWLPSPEMAVARVASRVQQGGHNVPEDVVIRRYHAGPAEPLAALHAHCRCLDGVRQLTPRGI